MAGASDASLATPRDTPSVSADPSTQDSTMDIALPWLTQYWWVVLLSTLVFGYELVLRLFGADRTLPDGRIVALNGEAGIQSAANPQDAGVFVSNACGGI